MRRHLNLVLLTVMPLAMFAVGLSWGRFASIDKKTPVASVEKSAEFCTEPAVCIFEDGKKYHLKFGEVVEVKNNDGETVFWVAAQACTGLDLLP